MSLFGFTSCCHGMSPRIYSWIALVMWVASGGFKCFCYDMFTRVYSRRDWVMCVATCVFTHSHHGNLVICVLPCHSEVSIAQARVRAWVASSAASNFRCWVVAAVRDLLVVLVVVGNMLRLVSVLWTTSSWSVRIGLFRQSGFHRLGWLQQRSPAV